MLLCVVVSRPGEAALRVQDAQEGQAAAKTVLDSFLNSLRAFGESFELLPHAARRCAVCLLLRFRIVGCLSPQAG